MLIKELKKIFKDLKEIDIGKYSYLKYPKFLPMMKMKVKSYSLVNFGSIMIMETSMMKMMKLTTISFTPSSGINVPFLLIDTMSMGKKRIAFIEFYNTTDEKYLSLELLKEKYQNIEDYQEKEAWYVNERMKGSLIKCSTSKEENLLLEMIKDALTQYKNIIDNASYNENNINRLKEFSSRMINEGNPSSKTLNKVLGKQEAEIFFKKIVMPL